MDGKKSAKRRAASLAAVYVVVSGVYIWISSRVARRAAPDVDDLFLIEAVKGTAFVVVTGALVGLGSWWMLRRAAKDAAELRRSREALLMAEQRALAGLLASSVAHDFNNLLVPLHAGIRELREEPPASFNEYRRELLEEMSEAVQRLLELSRRQTTMGREGGGRFSEVDLARVVRESLQIAHRHTDVRAMKMSVTGPDELFVHANPTLLQQVILNLILNAGEATQNGGRLEVRFGEEHGEIFLQVEDDGPGFSSSEQPFEPFFTTKAEGTGLGLYSVRTCAALHGGSATIVSSSLGGGGVRVSFPRAQEKPRDAPGGPPVAVTVEG